MPLYLYACKGCEHTLEKRSTIADRNLELEVPCPECEGTNRYISLGAVATVGGVSVTDKRPHGWRDVLEKVHKSAGKQSTVNT